MSLPAQKIEPASAQQTEDRRLAALDRYDVLDTPEEAAFNRVAELMRVIFKVDSAVVSLVDGHRQWYKAASGAAAAGAEVPMPETFCQTTLKLDGLLVVPDA